VGHRRQHLDRVGAAVMAQELPRPAVDLAPRVEVLPLDRARQVGHLVGARCVIGR
jgi:hypothetical protein